MSKMKPDRKPPLPKSPIRVLSRRVLRSTTTSSVQTPPGYLTESNKLSPAPEMEESDLRPEYRTISWELRALARMVHDEFGKENTSITRVEKKQSANCSPLLERGRFYDVYSARRNERLKRKKWEEAPCYNLGVNMESSKKRDSKKLESLRKTLSAAYSVERSEIPRYSLRSLSRENKKPPSPVVNSGKSIILSEGKTGASRVRKI